MDAETLNDVAVVSVNEAARLGRVTDILLATEPLRVAALRAGGTSGEFVLPFERIANFGSDAVMVESPNVTELSRQGGSFGQLLSLADLKKFKIVDDAGTYLGTLRAVDFDPSSGRVDRLSAEAGGVLGIGGRKVTIEASEIRSVGNDLVTVASSVDDEA